jgi:D-glycero-beta-D-manno-heptose 1-phosphate adenylyltransferase
MRKELSNKIISINSLGKLDFSRKKTVLMGGAFDIIHTGHIEHITEAKKLGDALIVHITGDKRLWEKKRRKPFFTELDRAKIISSITGVNFVFIYNGRHYDQKIINLIKPSILFFNKEAFQGQVKYFVENKLSFSGKIVISKAKKINSSSKIIKKLGPKINKYY